VEHCASRFQLVNSWDSVSRRNVGGNMADQANRPHRKGKEKKPHSGGPNPKAFAFATPGKLQKQAARSHDVWVLVTPVRDSLLTNTEKRKTPPCTARRPSSRRSPSDYCRRRWPSRSRKNDPYKVSDQTIHEADTFYADGPSHSCNVKAATTHVHRMSGRFTREHDRYRKGGGHCAVND
jgi:hypothetical protein